MCCDEAAKQLHGDPFWPYNVLFCNQNLLILLCSALLPVLHACNSHLLLLSMPRDFTCDLYAEVQASLTSYTNAAEVEIYQLIFIGVMTG